MVRPGSQSKHYLSSQVSVSIHPVPDYGAFQGFGFTVSFRLLSKFEALFK